MNPILVTGGAGFIGSNLVRALLREGRTVRVLDDFSAGTRGYTQDIEKEVELVEGSVVDSAIVERAAAGVEAIVHLAARSGIAPSVEDPRADFQINVLGTFNVAEAARRRASRRVVLASSGAAIGDATPPLRETTLPRPVAPYGVSKLYGENILRAYSIYELSTISLRFSNVYGPWSAHKSSVIAAFVKSALRGEPLTIYGDGEQVRDFVFVGDIVRGIQRALDADFRGVMHLGTGTPKTVNQLVNTLSSILGSRLEANYEGPRRGDVRQNFVDASEAARRLDWRPEVSFDAGLRETIAWMRSVL